MDAHGVLTFAVTVAAAAIPIAVPILFAALGEIVAEKAGIINIGIEGMMLIGAWAAYLGSVYTGSLGHGAILGALAGALLGLFLAAFYVTLGTDQVVTGILSNILVLGVTNLTYELLFRLNRPRLPAAPHLPIPGLAALPGLGPIFFNHGLLDYLAFAMVPVTYVLLRRTWFGLNVRAVGEHPEAADTAGIDVHLVRYAAMVFAGIMAALGGASLAIDEIQGFVENASAGRGFIALAVVVLAKWHPFGVLAGVGLVGITDALQLRLQAMGLGLPHELLLMLPYLLTIVVLIGFVGNARYPAAAGLPYRKR
jgi:general nucleoside transport system permease protein